MLMRSRSLTALAIGLSAALASTQATAQAANAHGVYTQLGVLGVGLGYAHGLSQRVTLRADVMSLGSRSTNETEEGIDYKAGIKIGRVGLFADYFPLGGGFRLTAGATFNQNRIDLRSRFDGVGSVTIGDQTVTPDADDFFNVDIKFPKVTPYVGIGWGHQATSKGWGVVADLGVSIGRAKVKASTNLIGNGITQDDVDRELADLRDGVGKIRFWPQATVGVSYRY